MRGGLRNISRRAFRVCRDGANGTEVARLRVRYGRGESICRCLERSAMAAGGNDPGTRTRPPGCGSLRDRWPCRTFPILFNTVWKEFAWNPVGVWSVHCHERDLANGGRLERSRISSLLVLCEPDFVCRYSGYLGGPFVVLSSKSRGQGNRTS